MAEESESREGASREEAAEAESAPGQTGESEKKARQKLAEGDLERKLSDHQRFVYSEGKEGQRLVLPRTDLKGANLIGRSLQGADFTDCNLVGALLMGARLEGAKLEGTLLLRARLEEAHLLSAHLKGAWLREAHLSGADLTDVDLRGASLRDATGWSEAELKGVNLEGASGLLGHEFARNDVTGTTLPEDVKRFDALTMIEKASGNARKIFLSMLLGCAYAILTVATTTDARLLPNSATSPLPIIRTTIPIVGFYAVAPLVLFGFFVYFHLCMQKIWERMATLPAFLPDGRKLNEATDPWLMAGLVQSQFPKLIPTRTPMDRLQHAITIVLGWFAVPLTLLVLWGRYLRRHDGLGTSEQILLLTVAVAFAVYSYWAAMSTLRGEPLKMSLISKGSRRFTVTAVLSLAMVLIGTPLLSYAALQGRIPFWNASFRDADVSTKPANWTGDDPEQLKLVKPAILNGANLRAAKGQGAFLAKAYLHRASLIGADLIDANLIGADLRGASLIGAQLFGADLSRANLRAADLSEAYLSGAELLTCEQLTKAKHWQLAYRDEALACGAPIPKLPDSQEE